jgi:uncharacterized protein YjbI with pentapeptide repeats
MRESSVPPSRTEGLALDEAPRRRRWSEEDWERVLARLRSTGIVDDTDEVDLSATDVQRLLQAAPRNPGSPHFTKAVFIRTHFGDDVDFSDVIFDDASFVQATFGDRARFFQATFHHRTDFMRATFGLNPGFVRARFGSGADFSDTRFGPIANFTRCPFEPLTGFAGAAFEADAVFRFATFGGDATFHDASFGDRADFRDASLEGVSFERATIAGIYLNRARFDYRT